MASPDTSLRHTPDLQAAFKAIRISAILDKYVYIPHESGELKVIESGSGFERVEMDNAHCVIRTGLTNIRRLDVINSQGIKHEITVTGAHSEVLVRDENGHKIAHHLNGEEVEVVVANLFKKAELPGQMVLFVA